MGSTVVLRMNANSLSCSLMAKVHLPSQRQMGPSAGLSVTLGLTGSALGETVELKEPHLGLDTSSPVLFAGGL